MSPEREPRPPRWRWLPDVGAVGVVAVLLVAKCWNLVRPWDRHYQAGDFSLSIEPHFYHYRQPEFWLGLAISGATALALAVGGVLGRRRARAHDPTEAEHPQAIRAAG